MEYDWHLAEDNPSGEERCRRLQDRNAFEGIENDGIDFCELEKYINEDTSGTYFDDTLATGDVARAHAAVVAAAPGDDLGQPLAPPPQPDSNKTFVAGVYVIPSHGLPESPPDSGSEPPYSPQDHGGQSPHQRLSAGRAHTLQDILIHPMYPVHQPLAGPLVAGQHLVDLPPPGLSAGLPAGPTHTLHLQGAGGEMILVQHPVVPAGLPPAVASPPLAMHGDGQSVVYPGLAGGAVAASPALPTKKRKLSQDGRIHVKTEPGMAEMSPDPSSNQTGALEEDYGLDCDNPYADSSMQCIRFSAFEPENWHVLIDGNLSELPAPKYQVVADKGFNFSNADDAFVCQKKNHFQITCHVRLHGDAQFVRAESSIQKILSWQLHFYGVKTEATAQTIKVEQSQSDRSKRAFHPVQVELRPDESVKKTVGRLHFSETTSNNMRKKGKPNPDQRYFYLVVGLHAHCADGNAYPVVAHNSERIIVRASNPGQFESDAELCWQKGSVSDSIYHTGKCGINTDRPEEALTVHGNLRITGHVIQPSDLRAKEAIQECDTRKQLRNVQQIRVVHYRYTDEFARHAGLPSSQNTGVIAQQVEGILPEAVTSAGDVVLPNGARLDNFLVVNKERLFMENVGAVKELCKVTDNLETRIDELERMNRRLNLKRLERLDSLKSVSSSVAMRPSRSSKTGSFASFTDGILCSNKLIQSTIVILVLIIAFCLVAMATLYFLEFQKRNDNYDIPISRQTVIQTQTHPPALSTPRPSKMRYKSGATPYSKKLTTIAPSILKQQKADREGVKAERGDGGRAEKATAAPRPPPPPLPSGPPPPQHQQPPHPPVLGIPPLCDGDQAGCPTYCCQADPPPSAPVVRDADYNAVPTAPAPPPDPHSKATPPPYLATNALSSRPQREVLNNVDDEPGDQDKHAQQPTVTVTLLGANVNHTLGPGGNPNNSYEVFLSRHLPDPELQLHVRFVRPWLRPEQCDSKPGQQCPRERSGAPWAKEDASGQPSGSPADGAAKQHLSRVGEAAVAPDARASVASADVHVIHVKIAYHVSYTVVFRVPLADNPNEVCKRTADGLGRDFLEYRIHFVRRCDL